jgi:thiol-disulfide isomerase/thioredoxin
LTVARFHHRRIELLHEVLKHAQAWKQTSESDILNYEKQVVDSLAAAYQTGQFDAGLKTLDTYAAKPGKIGSYAGFRKVLAQYALDSEQPGNELKAQKEYLSLLDGFVKKYPNSEEAPDALFQVASLNEFNAEEAEARKYYGQIVERYAGSEAAKKAAGAVRRLDLIGKPLKLSGAGLNGSTVSIEAFQGKTILVNFWTTGAEPVRRGLTDLVKVTQKYQPKGLVVIGVNLDDAKETVEAFVKEHGLTWPQIWEAGGMDSRLANEFGIISQPTMFLVDAKGNVVSRNIHSAAELERFLDKLLSAGDAGRLGLGPK